MKTKVLNFFAGPGAGKSSLAADVFAELKWRGKNVELVTEVAKDLTWDKHFNVLSDQLYVSAMQNRRLNRVNGQVDFIITDSPLPLFAVYHTDDLMFKTVMHVWNQYTNLNFMVKRIKKYNPAGRSQDEVAAAAIDVKVHELLINNKIDYSMVEGSRDGKWVVMNRLEDHGWFSN